MLESPAAKREKKRMNPDWNPHRIPKDLMGCIVGYLDMGTDHFIPGFEKTWKVTTRYNWTMDRNQDRRHWVNDTLHSVDGRPAVLKHDGTKVWYEHGKIHRGHDLPAIESPDETKQWMCQGKLHRENDLPAIEHGDGTRWWYRNGKLFRRRGQHTVELKDGTLKWTNAKGELHRMDDLPAVVRPNGTKEWWFNGFKHRDYGKPTIEHANGACEWWLHDTPVRFTSALVP